MQTVCTHRLCAMFNAPVPSAGSPRDTLPPAGHTLRGLHHPEQNREPLKQPAGLDVKRVLQEHTYQSSPHV